MKAVKSFRKLTSEEEYGAFEQMNGLHPWAEKVPEGSILYPVRQLSGGKVSYFNFDLAKDMGLIAKSHPNRMNKKLSEKVLETFCVRIINEYDVQNGARFARSSIKPNKYMATRYLQLQHSDKTGRTSGDGRCIWNGIVFNKGRFWDISSRGTGVTALAPGAVEAGQPLKSGNTDHGYGCGMAEIDELFGAAILAEVFHRNGIPTERVLAIIDLGKGVGIGVRAAPNLIRPAHLFLYLKQGKIEPLKRSLDYLIDRQFTNKVWPIRPDDKDRYTHLLEEVTRSFARFAALLERDYIFAWLDWDGDNVLADAGIIDYGSVRQFGLRHDQYRYDDVERFSTNLNEQRLKARDMVQTFVQLVDYAQTGVKKTWKQYSKSAHLKAFDRHFDTFCLERFLYQVGFAEPLRRILMHKHRRDVQALYNAHSEFERIKTYRKLRKVADGVHRPAIFNMRVALSSMAEYLDGLPMDGVIPVEAEEFFDWILSSQAARKDRKLTRRLRQKIAQWQNLYLKVVRRVSGPVTWEKTVRSLHSRSARINHDSRITGNALIHIVDEILRYRRRGLSDAEIQAAIEELTAAQTLNPDFQGVGTGESLSMKPLVRSFLSVVHGYREDI
ncbi:MAG: hypothetical protein KF799_03770 [Bdellovibrionales bacterium]|nr:hypothetical protein [Bdellovibrionales bacterium]